jgi:hypothetical protein
LLGGDILSRPQNKFGDQIPDNARAFEEISQTEIWGILFIFGIFSGLEIMFLASIDLEIGWMVYFKPIYHMKVVSYDKY